MRFLVANDAFMAVATSGCHFFLLFLIFFSFMFLVILTSSDLSASHFFFLFASLNSFFTQLIFSHIISIGVRETNLFLY